MTPEDIEDLVTAVSSLKVHIAAVEEVLLNFTGIVRDDTGVLRFIPKTALTPTA